MRRLAYAHRRRDIQEIALTPIGQAIPELTGTTELIIADDPGMRQVRRCLEEQLVGQFPSLAEHSLLRHADAGAAIRVASPRLGQIELRVDESVSSNGRVPEVVANLAVIYLAQPPAPLPLHANRVRSLLVKARVVHHQDAAGIADLPCDLGSYLLANPLVLPAPRANEGLQRPTRQADAGRNGLDRFPFQVAQQAPYEHAQMPALLCAQHEAPVGHEELLQRRQHSFDVSCLDPIRIVEVQRRRHRYHGGTSCMPPHLLDPQPPSSFRSGIRISDRKDPGI